jgi:transposase-like protein
MIQKSSDDSQQQCPECGSIHIQRNGHRGDKQNLVCAECGRQFMEKYTVRGYSQEIKEICLKMYCNGMGFRQIERCTGVNHNTVINWVRKIGEQLPEHPPIETVPIVGELDELQTFVGSKKTLSGCGLR